MGFTTGFTGGVTLTLSLAYLGTLAHRRHREHQAAVLRQQTLLLTAALHDPKVPSLPPLTRAERLAEERHKLIDTAKGRWNAELEHAARWAQTKDWEEVRDDIEDAVAGLWARAFGGGGGGGSGGESAVLENATDKAKAVASRARSEARDAANKVVDEVADSGSGSGGGGGGGGGVLGALGKGFSRGKEAIASFGRAKTEAEIAEEKAAEKLRDNLSGLSPEERAMKQRYQKSGTDDRSVEEILAERYLPTDGKNTKLKAL